MNQAKGLESDSDGSSVVSFEETPEERRQRKLVKKQKQRRQKDRELRKQQSLRRKQRDEELTLHLRALKEEQERERAARWGTIHTGSVSLSGSTLRPQDVPRQPYEATHPAFNRGAYPRKMLGEHESNNAALKSPVTFGFRVDYEKLGEEHKLPLPSTWSLGAPVVLLSVNTLPQRVLWALRGSAALLPPARERLQLLPWTLAYAVAGREARPQCLMPPRHHALA
jgi:hypothetical protein